MAAVVAGTFVDWGAAAGGGAGIGVGAAAAILALASRRFASAACFPVRVAVVVATGPIRGAGSVAAASAAGVDAAPSAGGWGADAAGPAEADVGGAEGVAEAPGEGVAVGAAVVPFCLAIAPVTESRPCSRVDRREYIRSRSLLSVSIADASRLVSFWLSRATDWICCACRDRSAAASSSCRNRNDDWLASSATMMAPTEAAPQVPSRSIARRSRCSSSARKPDSTPPVFSVAKSARWSFFFAIGVFRPPRGLPPNHAANINRKCASSLNPGRFRSGFRFPLRRKTLYAGGGDATALIDVKGFAKRCLLDPA